MGISIDVTPDTFVQEVIERSQHQLVVVDFFAQWCGPCQMLKPILEKLVQEYDFALAKVDIDQNPELANQYRVEGVPDVRICDRGELKPGFVGVLAEPQIRALLAGYNLKSDLEIQFEALEAARAAGKSDEAQQQLNILIGRYPYNPRVAIAAAEFFMQADELGMAQQFIDSVSYNNREYYPKAQALQALIHFKQDVANLSGETELDQQFQQAAQLTLQGNYEAALPQLLAIVERDRKYRKDAARKAMLMIFSLLGDEHPLTRQYRKQLTLALY